MIDLLSLFEPRENVVLQKESVKEADLETQGEGQ